MESSFAFEDLHLGLLEFAPAATVTPVDALPAAPTIAAASFDPPSSPATHQVAGAAPAPVIDPIALWEQAVAAQMRTGVTKAAAVRTVASMQPELHASYIAEYNARELRRRAPARTSPAPTGFAAIWENAIRIEMLSTGCNRFAAVRTVASKQPELHASYIAEYNAQRVA